MQDDPHKAGTEDEKEEKGGVEVVLVVVVPVIFRMLHTDLSHHHAVICPQTRVPIHQLILGKTMTAGKGISITMNIRKV